MNGFARNFVTPSVLSIVFSLTCWQSLALAQQQESGDQTAGETAALVEDVVEEIITVGRSQSAAQSLLNERMDSATSIDLLGAEAISRLGDSTVAAALRRMPGLTLVNDKYIYIRGLGERYSASFLNGAQIPSPDLTRNVIPLDIFPAAIVESIRVQKSYSPDMPANFGGGSVDVRTFGIPDAFTMNFELGTGTNTENNGSLYTHPGGSDDKLGTDDGSRALSPELMQQIVRFRGNVDVQGILAALQADDPTLTSAAAFSQAQKINRELGLMLNRNIGLQQKDVNPDFGAKVNVGNSFDLNEDWQIGFLAGGTYTNVWRETEAISRNFRFPEERTDTELESTQSINISGNLNMGLRFTEDHEISTTSLFLRNTDNETAIRDFFNENRERSDGLGFRNVRFQFEEREMMVNQIKGNHYIGQATRERLPDGLLKLVGWIPEEAEFSWFYSQSTARTDIPSQTEIESQTVTDPATAEVLASAVALDATAADYRFTNLDDDVLNFGWSASYPISFGSSFLELGFGYDHSQKTRTYQQSQFSLGALRVDDPTILQGPFDLVFSDEYILDPLNNFVFDTQGTNNQSYIAATMTDAAFGTADWSWNEIWRVAAGLRWEDYRQAAVDWNPLGYSVIDPQVSTDVGTLQRQVFRSDDIFAAAAVTYMTEWWAETFQLRFGFSQTAIRPDLREITDASYIDPRTDDLVDGNPGIIPASVDNYDIRAEWFFESGGNLTVTLFYKNIEKPIEFFESAASDTTTAREIINAESAEVYGVEVEALRELGFLADFFSSFFVQGNFTLQDSELVAGDQADAPTNPVRPLTGASEYVANLALGFDSPGGKHTATLAYNVFGERLYVAGRNGAPDGYEQPFRSLDLVWSWYPTNRTTVKAKAQNLLDESIQIEREGIVTFEEKPGSNFVVSFQLAF